MTNSVENADHKLRRTTDSTGASTGLQIGTAAIVDFLQLLARAVRQFHTYPATSPLCTDAIGTCHRAFMALELEQPLSFRVAPAELILGDDAVGRGTIIEQELSRPLHRARVASLEIDCAVSVRDWGQLCEVLAAGGRTQSCTASLAELLLDRGVAAIVPRVTPRPEVLELGAPPSAVQTLVERERTRQASLGAGSPAQHLYPPDKGWVRLDPTVGFDVISLLDLTVLVNDPAELAGMLTRLIDETPSAEAADGVALEQRYSDVVMLISALDPRLGRMLFSKLAHAVLGLESDRRRVLLRRAILPGLLDQRLDGEMVLSQFPDVDLADALCLLLDLEAASPDLLPLALDRLQLQPERRAGLVPLIESNVKKRSTPETGDRWASSGLERQAGMLTRIESGVTKNFGEFAAFDLSINEHTTSVLAGVRETIFRTEGIDAQLTCGLGLVKIEPNPAVVAAVLGRGLPALQALVREHRWQDFSRWIARLSEVADELDSSRPDVANAVRETLRNLSDRELVLQLAHLCGTEPERTYAAAIAAGLGQSIVPAWLEALDAPPDRARIRPFAGLMHECARRVAPAIVERLPTLGNEAARAAVAVLGFAGPGYESAIAGQVSERDQRCSREALGALARIGSAKAAALIVAQLERGPAAGETVAEDALWQLPGSLGLTKARELLGRREFVTRHPHSAARLLERAVEGTGDRIDGVLESLLPLRFHFWSPAVARVGAKARSLLR